MTALMFEVLPKPEQWPLAAVLLEADIQGDGSGIEAVAAGATSDQVRMLLQEQGVALVCADSPARHPAGAWPRVVDRLEAVSPGRRTGGGLDQRSVRLLADGQRRPATPGPGMPPPATRSWSSAPRSTDPELGQPGP